jgi:hypothetical protein
MVIKKNSAENRESSSGVSSEQLSSAMEADKMALWVQLAVGPWREDFTCAVIQWDCYSSCVRIRCQETDSGDCNTLRILVCVAVNWGSNDGVTVVYSATCEWSINPIMQNPVYNHAHTNTWQCCKILKQRTKIHFYSPMYEMERPSIRRWLFLDLGHGRMSRCTAVDVCSNSAEYCCNNVE